MLQDSLIHFWNAITIESILKFCVVYFFVVWIALVIWVTRDITNRTRSHIYQIFCIFLVVLFTPFGIFLYLLIRPRRTIFEKYYAEVEGNLDILWNIVQERLEKNTTFLTCPECYDVVEEDFIICPNCHANLKHTCISCKKEIRTNWEVCPFCRADQTKKTWTKKSVSKKEVSEKKEMKKDEDTPKKSPVVKDKNTLKKDTQKEEKDAKETPSKKTD